MKSNAFEVCLLYDFYGDILTAKQKDAIELYYNEDLSLSEISEILGITRQGARDAIVRSEAILRDTEAKLGLVEKFGRISLWVNEINESVDNIRELNENRIFSSDLDTEIDKIYSVTRKILG